LILSVVFYPSHASTK